MNLRVTSNGSDHTLQIPSVPHESWSIHKQEGGGYEAASGQYGLGTFEDPFDAFMAVVGDMGRRCDADEKDRKAG